MRPAFRKHLSISYLNICAILVALVLNNGTARANDVNTKRCFENALKLSVLENVKKTNDKIKKKNTLIPDDDPSFVNPAIQAPPVIAYREREYTRPSDEQLESVSEVSDVNPVSSIDTNIPNNQTHSGMGMNAPSENAGGAAGGKSAGGGSSMTIQASGRVQNTNQVAGLSPKTSASNSTLKAQDGDSSGQSNVYREGEKHQEQTQQQAKQEARKENTAEKWRLLDRISSEKKVIFKADMKIAAEDKELTKCLGRMCQKVHDKEFRSLSEKYADSDEESNVLAQIQANKARKNQIEKNLKLSKEHPFLYGIQLHKEKLLGLINSAPKK